MLIHVPCGLCGANNTHTLFTATDTNYYFAGRFNIVRCKECGLVYLNPRPDQDSILQYYPDQDYTCFKETTIPTPLTSNHPMLLMARSEAINVRALCDIGSGIGSFLLKAQLAGYEVAGIEPHSYALNLANRALKQECVYRDFETANFPNEAFDAVTMWHVFEHLPHLKETLLEIHRILRSPGILSLAVPNFSSLERRLWGPNWIAIMAPTHFYHFTENSLTQLLEMCGFEVVSIQQHMGATSLAANLLRSARNVVCSAKELLKIDPIASTPIESTDNDRVLRQSPSFTMGESRKERIRDTLTWLVSPAAWLIAKCGLGPELMVHAVKR